MIDNSFIVKLLKKYNVPSISIHTIDNDINTSFIVDNVNENFSDDTLFNACSISKLLTSLLVLQLATKGKIDLDDYIDKYLSNIPIKTIDYFPSFRQLLSHTSGIKDPLNSFEELKINECMPKVKDLLLGNTRYCNQKIEITNTPDTLFDYSDAGYAVIEYMIENIENQSFTKIMKTNIFDKLSMNHSFYPDEYTYFDNYKCAKGYTKDNHLIENEYSIYPYPSGSGLWTTSLDLSKILNEISDIKEGCSKLGISQEFYTEMISHSKCSSGVGLGVFIDYVDSNIELSSLGWGIGYQSGLLYYPEVRQGIIVMTNKDSGMHQLDSIIGELFQAWSKHIVKKIGTKSIGGE